MNSRFNSNTGEFGLFYLLLLFYILPSIIATSPSRNPTASRWYKAAMSQLAAILNMFSLGVFDFLHVFIPFSLLIDSYTILYQTSVILLANTCLVIGSILIYHYGVQKLYDIVYSSLDLPLFDHILFMTIHSLWILPIFLYCQLSAASKYQALADSILEHLKSAKKLTISIDKYISNSSYGFLAWLLTFLQVQIASAVFPIVARSITMGLNMPSLTQPVLLATELITGLLSCALYAWYCFDYRWTSLGLDPDARFAVMERHWPYFVGFGFPFVFLNKMTTFFVGYGTFLAYFPMAVMIGTVVDYERSSLSQSTKVPPLQLFKLTRLAAKTLVGFLERSKRTQEQSRAESSSYVQEAHGELKQQ